MLDHILASVRGFENQHGITPNVVYINPCIYEALCKQCPGRFEPAHGVQPGFRFIILPRSRLSHPKAALLPSLLPHSRAARGQPLYSREYQPRAIKPA